MRPLAAVELPCVPAPRARHALHAKFTGGIHEDHGIALAVEPDLEEERRVDDEGARLERRARELGAALRLDPRVHDLLDVGPKRGIREDRLAEQRAVDRSVGPRDAAARATSSEWQTSHPSARSAADTALLPLPMPPQIPMTGRCACTRAA